MIYDFLLFFGQLNLASLISKKKKKVEKKCDFLEMEATEVLKYGKITMGIKMKPNYINK